MMMWKQIDKKDLGKYIKMVFNEEVPCENVIVVDFESFEMYSISGLFLNDALNGDNLRFFVKSKTEND